LRDSFLAQEAAQNQIVETIGGLIGPESAQAIQGMIENASAKPKTGIISTVLGAVTLLIGAGAWLGSYKLPSIRYGESSRNLAKVYGFLSASGLFPLPWFWQWAFFSWFLLL
jgi:hypothetical protein